MKQRDKTKKVFFSTYLKNMFLYMSAYLTNMWKGDAIKWGNIYFELFSAGRSSCLTQKNITADYHSSQERQPQFGSSKPLR
jgi:hypothetical protein